MELNPQHQITQAMRGQWHKALALVMMKNDLKEVVITKEDLDRLTVEGDEMPCVVAHDCAAGLVVKLMTMKEARQYVEFVQGGVKGVA